jgi:protein-S-isoprenylcysteine O-methyltransferase Ste14
VRCRAVFAAQLIMGESWRMGIGEGEETTLVTTGPFRLVRNPIYTSACAAVAGFALMVPNAPSLASVALFILAFELLVRGSRSPPSSRCTATPTGAMPPPSAGSSR